MVTVMMMIGATGQILPLVAPIFVAQIKEQRLKRKLVPKEYVISLAQV